MDAHCRITDDPQRLQDETQRRDEHRNAGFMDCDVDAQVTPGRSPQGGERRSGTKTTWEDEEHPPADCECVHHDT